MHSWDVRRSQNLESAMKLKGTVGRSDLEGGYFTFEAGGERYKLEGGGADLLRDGVSAEVEGEVKRDMMGIGFAAPVLRVKSYRVLQ
jgi:hypothetical protein